MTLDDDREIAETRAFFQDHGLLPPIPDRYADDEREAERARLRILAQTTPAAPSRVWRRRALLAAAVAALVVIGLGAQALLRDAPADAAGTPAMLVYSVASPRAVDSAPSSDEVLRDVARKAADTSSSQHRTGDVQYLSRYGWQSSEQVDANGTASVAVYPTLTQWWLAEDGTVRVDESRAAPLDLSGRAMVDAPDAPARITSETSSPGTIAADRAAHLPVDPVALRPELLKVAAGLSCDQDAWWLAQCLFQAVQTIYDQYVVTPELASAMWSVLAGDGTLRTLGTTEDRLGRPASTVALPPEPGQSEEQVIVLLISTDTGAYLGTETVQLRSPLLGIDKPTVLGFSELTAARWVDAVGDTS